MKYKIIEQLLNNNFSNEICDKIWDYLLPKKIKYNCNNLIVMSPFEIRKISRNYHLTIKDILELPIGTSIDIFCMDRNLFDFCIYEEHNKIISADKFFRNGYIIHYTKINGLIGYWKFINITDDIPEQREFDIDVGTFWYPLFNNKVPKEDFDMMFKIPINFAGKHYTELPLDTRIGWRGPCMLLKNVKKLPKILLKKEYY
tara:strand:+ start:828 stop:1430 length:603 start_codon:yes stop_codon:yes gene_type:complete